MKHTFLINQTRNFFLIILEPHLIILLHTKTHSPLTLKTPKPPFHLSPQKKKKNSSESILN